MDPLLERALAFQKLLDIEYEIVLGRKKRRTDLHIHFEPFHFHHLIGLHKLKDLYVARQNREKVFDNILSGKLCYEMITRSRFYPGIQRRFESFLELETLLDKNELVFRYNTKLNQFSVIEADYLLSTLHDKREMYIFLTGENAVDSYICSSFFPKEKMDYTKGQMRYAMLYKAKRNKLTGTCEIQYDRLSWQQ